MSAIEDADLVAAYLAGDRSALAAIYDRYSASMYDTAASMTRSRHDAADVMQDVFLVAAERLGQLRDPHRLKPWLFAILRNEVFRRTGRKRRTVTTDFTDPVAEMSLPPDHDDPTANAEYAELAALVRGAAAGLDERDQLVLELSVRQGLEGDDLAAALGVSTQQSYSIVHRTRQRTERALGAFAVARKGRNECPELDRILQGWDGEFTVLIRKRVARHIDRCDICERSRRALAPLALFGAAPAFAAPAGLRDRVLAATEQVQPVGPGGGAGGIATYGFGAAGGFPAAAGSTQKPALWILCGVAALVLLIGTAVYVLADGDSGGGSTTTTTSFGGTTTTSPAGTTTLAAIPPTATTSTTSSTTSTSTTSTSTTSTSTSTTSSTTSSTTTTTTTTTVPPTTTTTTTPTTTTTSTTTTTTTTVPGSLSVSAGSIDFGTSVDTARVRLSNPGGQPLDWSTTTGPVSFRGVASPFSFTPASGTLQPGDGVDVEFGIDRAWPNEGDVGQRVTFFAGDVSATVDLTGTIARPPEIRLLEQPPTTTCSRSGPAAVRWEAGVADETEPITTTLTVRTPSGNTVDVDVTFDISTWLASYVLDADGDGLADPGVHRWTFGATDGLGNAATVSGAIDVDPDC